MTDTFQVFIDRIEALLDRRLAVYPRRDKSYGQLVDIIGEFFTFLSENIDFGTFTPRHDVVQSTESFRENPVFICGPMKSGTSLLVYLMDNHPDLQVMPGDSNYVSNISKWEKASFQDIAEHWLQRIINPTGNTPFWFFGKNRADFENLLSYLYFYLGRRQVDVFVSVVLAIYSAGADANRPPKKYWVEKAPHNELNAPFLAQRHPRAKFIQIFRDPLENIVSLKKFSQMRGWDTSPVQSANMLQKLYRSARENEKKLGRNRYWSINYEHLVSSPQETLNGLCEFLGISFSPTLLTPTQNGRPASSNSIFKEARIQGYILDQSQEKRYKKNLSEKELGDVVPILYRDAVSLGYDWTEVASLAKKKTISRYVEKVKSRVMGAIKNESLPGRGN